MKQFIYILAIVTLLSCGEDPELSEGKRNIVIDSSATLFYTGALAADGCEYFVEIDGIRYKPVNEDVIPENFQKEQMRVRLTAEKLANPIHYQCGLNPAPTTYNAIRILSIRRG